jgi:hypothetical protein
MARTCTGQILALGMTGDKSAVPARVPTVKRVVVGFGSDIRFDIRLF